jgi:hypothetical protein
MHLVEYLSNPAPFFLSGQICFFSPHFAMRHLLYHRLKQVSAEISAEYSFTSWEGPQSLSGLTFKTKQRGLFSQKHIHCLFIDQGDFSSSKAKEFLKSICQTLKSDGHLTVIVGNWKISALDKKLFSPSCLWIQEPRLDQMADLSSFFQILATVYPDIKGSFETFCLYLRACDGDVTLALNSVFVSVLIQEMGFSEALSAKTIDVFTLSKRWVNQPHGLDRLLPLVEQSIHGFSDWFPILGMLHKLLMDLPEKSQALMGVAAVDKCIKHFYPSSRQHELSAVLMSYIHQKIHSNPLESERRS